MPVYNYEQLLEISKSDLVKSPKFLYEELSTEVAEAASETAASTEPEKPVESKPLVVGDEESDLTFLAQRYLERGTGKSGKKDATAVSSKLVVTQLNTASSGNHSKTGGSHIAAASEPAEGATDGAGDDGWISVGPKHQAHHRNNHGRRSFGSYDRNSRRSHGKGSRPDTASWRNNGAPSKPPGLSGNAKDSSAVDDDFE